MSVHDERHHLSRSLLRRLGATTVRGDGLVNQRGFAFCSLLDGSKVPGVHSIRSKLARHNSNGQRISSVIDCAPTWHDERMAFELT